MRLLLHAACHLPPFKARGRRNNCGRQHLGVCGREHDGRCEDRGSRKKDGDPVLLNRFRSLTPHLPGSISGASWHEPPAAAGGEMDSRTRGGVMRRNSIALYVLLSLCISAVIASAQEITGSIVGTVSDKSGALIVGASVSVVNADKNNVVVRILSTNGNGEYVAPFLPIGHYELVAEA